ncbi:MAG: hypothetical protein ACJAZX_000843 [Rickettsiales bacterium]|jgi:hypothetical protein
MKIACINIQNTINIGDLSCTPYHYFPFPSSTLHDLNDTTGKKYEIAIFGGGAIHASIKNSSFMHQALHKVAWGVGSSLSRGIVGDLIIPNLDEFAFYGVREYERFKKISKNHKNVRYTPCVTCMSDLFDKPSEPEHEIGFYLHGSKTPADMIDKVPSEHLMLNRCATFKESIEFLSKYKTIVTNSFHGTYWSLLLNKKVISIPFSSKFYGFTSKPSYAKFSNWEDIISSAEPSNSGYLEKCRFNNVKFYEEACIHFSIMIDDKTRNRIQEIKSSYHQLKMGGGNRSRNPIS